MPVVAQGHKRATVKGTGCGLIFNIFIFLALVTRQSAAFSSTTQHNVSKIR